MSISFLLFIAGLDTVTNAMTYGMRHLARDQALQTRLRQDPSLIPATVETLLRLYTFVNTIRVVMRETELDGVTLKPGELIWCVLWGGSNDPDAETGGPRHMAFGGGHHICLGMYLARLELRVMYETWFERIGRFTLARRRPARHARRQRDEHHPPAAGPGTARHHTSPKGGGRGPERSEREGEGLRPLRLAVLNQPVVQLCRKRRNPPTRRAAQRNAEWGFGCGLLLFTRGRDELKPGEPTRTTTTATATTTAATSVSDFPSFGSSRPTGFPPRASFLPNPAAQRPAGVSVRLRVRLGHLR